MNSSEILYHITVASKPDELVETLRGQVTYLQWCEEEVVRIRRKGNWPVAIYTNPSTGEISVVHLKVTRQS